MNIEDILKCVEESICEILVEDYAGGANDYAWVRVYPSGHVASGREPSWCVGEGEYYGRVPHALTVWSASGLRESVGADGGIFYWEDSDTGEYIRETDSPEKYEIVNQISEEDLAAKIADGWIRFTLDRTSSGLVENIDLGDLLKGIESQIIEWVEAGNLSHV